MANTQYVAWVAPSSTHGGASTSPNSTPTGLETVFLWRVNVRIPPGHAGLTGIALVDSGTFIVPYGGSEPAWLIGDDDDLDFPYGKQTGNNVVLYTYNSDDTYDHAWQVRLVYTPMSDYAPDEAVLYSPDPGTFTASLAQDEA